MTRTDVIKFISETYSVEPEYLWDGETHAVFRHPVSCKWFGIIMNVKRKVLCIHDEKNCFEERDNFAELKSKESGENFEDIMNVKINPVLIEDLLHEDAFVPAYHMNKKYWISIRLNLVTENAVRKLIDESWNQVKPKHSVFKI